MPEKSTILYVEDDFNNRTLVRRVLEAEGYQLVDAANASQALECLERTQNRFDLDGYQHA